jgi:hypothetical protein
MDQIPLLFHCPVRTGRDAFGELNIFSIGRGTGKRKMMDMFPTIDIDCDIEILARSVRQI